MWCDVGSVQKMRPGKMHGSLYEVSKLLGYPHQQFGQGGDIGLASAQRSSAASEPASEPTYGARSAMSSDLHGLQDAATSPRSAVGC